MFFNLLSDSLPEMRLPENGTPGRLHLLGEWRKHLVLVECRPTYLVDSGYDENEGRYETKLYFGEVT